MTRSENRSRTTRTICAGFRIVSCRPNTERQALLSREFHDEVGQMMTALGIELGHIEDLKNADDRAFRERINDAKRLNGDAMRTIRDLAMGLRPSMLDDIRSGSGAAMAGTRVFPGIPVTGERRNARQSRRSQ